MSVSRFERLTRVMLLASLFGFLWRGYWVYSVEAHQNGIGPLLDFVHGIGPAPFQYRVGSLQIAYRLYLHLHLPFRYGFTLLDTIGLCLAVMLGYELLRRTEIYRRASELAQCFGSTAYLVLVIYLASWQNWYKKFETDPACGLVMLLLVLWSAEWRRGRSARSGKAFLTAAALLLTTELLSLVRADIALMLSIGMVVVAWWHRRGTLSLERGAAVAVAAACVVIAAGTQALLEKVIYPHARPYSGHQFILPYDNYHPTELMEFAVFLLPSVWALIQVRKRKFTADAASVGFLVGAIPYVLMWITMGRIEEVRIFLPIALAIVPLTVQMVMLSVEKIQTAPAGVAPTGNSV